MKNTLNYRNIIIIILSILILVFLFFFFNDKEEDNQIINLEKTNTIIPIGENINKTEEREVNITEITNFNDNQEIKSPVVITGEARGSWFFEASFPVYLYDDNGKEIVSSIAQAQSDSLTENFVPFKTTLIFAVPETNEGTLVFKNDNPSGLIENEKKIEIPIKFSKETQNISLYFYNEKKDKEIADYVSCSAEAVLPVERKVFLSQTPIQDTIKLLLQGNLTEEEKIFGFSTEFPLIGLELIGVNLKDGLLTLEFNDLYNKTIGGSCRVNLLWNQIVKTAKQFPEVKEVKFLPEDIFQP